MEKFVPGARFSFRLHPRWQFWKHGVGVAEIIATDPAAGVLHVRVLGVGPSVIAHLPIIKAAVQPYARGVSPWAGSPVARDERCLAAVKDWRARNASGTAGVFSVAIAEAIQLVFETAPDLTGHHVVESAYPVRDAFGEFRTVHVVAVAAV